MKRIVSALTGMMFLMATQAHAVAMRDVHVGAVYYHNAWNNNKKVQVLGIRGGSVKVMFLEGPNAGAIEFVPPRDLMTPSQSRDEAVGDAVEGVIITGAIFCALVGGCENNKKTYNKPRTYKKAPPQRSYTYKKPAPSYSKAKSRRSVVIRNSCRNPVKIALRLKTAANKWRTVGWYDIKPGRSITAADYKKKTLKNYGAFMYYHAMEYSTRYPKKWTGALPVYYRGATRKFKPLYDNKGPLNVNLC